MRGYFIPLLLLLTTCIDQFPLDGDIPEPEPVIEGLVADQKGLSFVRISSSLSINGIRGGDPGTFGSGAQVSVIDTQGTVIAFLEQSAGLYRPDSSIIAGQVGMSYQLRVLMPNGDQFQSDWEMMHPGVAIDSLFVRFKQTFVPNTEQLTGQHDFFITVSGKESSPVEFRTMSNGIAQVAAVIEPPTCGSLRCPEICYSYRTPINRQITLGNTGNTTEGRLTLQIATEPYDFHSLYFIRVTTYSLSPQGQRFWSSIANQQQIDGSIFDPQLNNIEGANILDLGTNEKIFGYFGASSTSVDSLLFNRSESAGFLAPIPASSGTCPDVWVNATSEVPTEFR